MKKFLQWLKQLFEVLMEIIDSLRVFLPVKETEFMKQGIQSKAEHPALRQSGCYFFAILAQVALQHGLTIDSDRAEELFYEAVRLGHVKPNCFVQNPVALANLAANKNAYRSISRERLPTVSVYIQRLKKPMFAHFVLIHNGQTWDPLDPKRPGAKGYEPCSYRVIT